MATCANCGHEIRDGVWTCGFCGEPVGRVEQTAASPYEYEEPLRDQNYYQAPTIYGTSAPTIPPLGASERSGRSFYLILGVSALVLCVAIVAVWFFFLRSTAGDFAGTWQTTSTSGQITKVRIESSGKDYKFFIVNPQGKDIGPFKATVHGASLESTLEFAGGDQDAEAMALMLRGIYLAAVDHFKLVLTAKDDNTLGLRIDGKPKSGSAGNGWNQEVVLKRSQP